MMKIIKFCYKNDKFSFMTMFNNKLDHFSYFSWKVK